MAIIYFIVILFLRLLDFVFGAFAYQAAETLDAVGVVDDELLIGGLQPEVALGVVVQALHKGNHLGRLVGRRAQFDASIQLVKGLWLCGKIHACPFAEGFRIVARRSKDVLWGESHTAKLLAFVIESKGFAPLLGAHRELQQLILYWQIDGLLTSVRIHAVVFAIIAACQLLEAKRFNAFLVELV